MESIRDIQTRIEGLADIRHLLRSVRAMSAIRWRRAKNHLEIAQSYAESIERQLKLLFTVMNISSNQVARLFGGGGASKNISVGLITLTSDRGLCGNFNTGLINRAIHITQVIRRKNKQVKIISFGGYGERLFKNAGYQIFATEQIPSQQAISFVNIRRAISHIKAYYQSGAIHELTILYNHFNYFGSYTPKVVHLLPPSFDKTMHTKQPIPEDLIVNSHKRAMLSFLLWEHLAARLYLAYIESTVSEHSARLQTMDSAIGNLDDRAQALEIKYHTIRQEKITQGVLEVQSNLRDRKKKST